MTVKFVFGCFGMLVFFAVPLFSQEMTEGPIGTVRKEVYVKNRVRNMSLGALKPATEGRFKTSR